MAVPLYNRYIPPQTVLPKPSQQQASLDVSPNESALKEKKKRKKRERNDETSGLDGNRATDVGISEVSASPIASNEHGSTLPSKDYDGAYDSRQELMELARIGTTPQTATSQAAAADPTVQTGRKRKRKHPHPATQRGAESAEDGSKHLKVMNKFQKSVEVSATQTTHNDAVAAGSEEASVTQLQDLVPIPIPQSIEQGANAHPTYQMLPDWLSNPIVAKDRTPFSKLPLEPSFHDKLTQSGLMEALPVQAAVLPLLLPHRGQHPGDLCVSATTGSGKTLSYVLPILESIKPHATGQLRAVIVVPTRELVSQVKDTIQSLIGGTNIRVGTASGTSPFHTEALDLVATDQAYNPQAYHQQIYRVLSAKKELDLADVKWNDYEERSSQTIPVPPQYVREYRSKVDILVCTPGRLVEHIKSTDGFHLRDLDWLVVDEADRLLDQSFQEWSGIINSNLGEFDDREQQDLTSTLLRYVPALSFRSSRRVRKVVLSATMTHDLDQLQSLKLSNPRLVWTDGSGIETGEGVNVASGTRDLSRKPHLPSQLKEYGLPVGDGSEKPLYLLELLQRLLDNSTAAINRSTRIVGDHTTDDVKNGLEAVGSEADDDNLSSSSDETSSSDESNSSGEVEDASSQSSGSGDEADDRVQPVKDDLGLAASNVLVFAASNEAVTRLAALLIRLKPGLTKQLTTLSKSTSGKEARSLASKVASGKTRVIIASDRASRGLDIPGLANVVNYDIPSSVTSYVHRVGRTARAGNEGAAFTLLEDRQARWFWNELGKPGGGIERDRGSKVERIRFGDDILESLRSGYADALRGLKEAARSQ